MLADQDMRWRSASMLIGLLVGAGVALDQLTKRLAHSHVRGRGVIEVVEGFFELRYARNPGAFFGLGADLSDSLRRWLFVLTSLLAIGLIVRLYLKSSAHHRALRVGLVLLLAGAFGNLIDRVLYGEVIDFLHLHWREVFHWATFNIADIYIAFGLGLLLFDTFAAGRPHAGKAEPLRVAPDTSAAQKRPLQQGRSMTGSAAT